MLCDKWRIILILKIVIIFFFTLQFLLIVIFINGQVLISVNISDTSQGD